MKKIVSLIVLWTLILSSNVAADHHHATTSTNTDSSTLTIVENAIASENLSTLVTAVKAADLVNTLNSDGPFTVFAPLNSAFEALPSATVESLLMPENKSMLTDILTYHVVAGELWASELSDGMLLKTVSGEKLKVTLSDWMVFINNSMVALADIQSSNGVVHVIDTVLMQWESAEMLTKKAFEIRTQLSANLEMRVDSVLAKYNTIIEKFWKKRTLDFERRLFSAIDKAMTKSSNTNFKNMLMLLKLEIQAQSAIEMLSARVNGWVLDIAMWSDNHTTLVAAVKAAGLVDALNSDGPFTIFAPTNSAFAALPEGTVENLLLPENKEELANILTYHVASGAYFPSDISNWLKLEMLNGKEIEFSVQEDGTVMVNNAKISTVNLVWNNWVIHVIDGVLIP